MPTGYIGDKEIFLRTVEHCIAADRQMSNFARIHHVWVHPDKAYLLDLSSAEHQTHKFRVEHKLPILIGGSYARTSKELCGFVPTNSNFIPIDLGLIGLIDGRIDVMGMERRLADGVADIDPKIIAEGGFIWVHPMLAFVATTYARASFKEAADKLLYERSAELKDVPFNINHTFAVEVSAERPKSVNPDAQRIYFCATVAEDGWVVGEKTPEEFGRRPY